MKMLLCIENNNISSKIKLISELILRLTSVNFDYYYVSCAFNMGCEYIITLT